MKKNIQTKRAWWRAVAAVVALLATAVAIVAGSLWIESRNHGPVGESSGMLGFFRKWLTRPVADAVGEGVRLHVRSRIDARNRLLLSGFSLEDTIRNVEDPGLDPVRRKEYALRLARLGERRGLDALLRVFQGSEGDERRFYAQLIGSTGHSRFIPWLLPLLDDPDQATRLAAIRGLGVIGTPETTAALAALLADRNEDCEIRLECAAALGKAGTTDARDALLAAIPAFPPEETVGLLRALGRFPFAEIKEVVTPFVNDPQAEVEHRVAVVESLTKSTPDCVPYLLEIAGRNQEPDIRAAAAWTVGSHGRGDGLGVRLASLAAAETDPFVRRRLYESMVPQGDIPAAEILVSAAAEEDLPARIAGFNAAGAALAGANHGQVLEFNNTAVPELQEVALEPNSLNLRMRSVFALRRANTDSARRALATIADASVPAEVANAARHGLSAGITP